eukprot:275113_1
MALNGMSYNITDKNINQHFMYFVGIMQPINAMDAGLPESCLNLANESFPCSVIAEDGSCIEFDTNREEYGTHTYAYQYDYGNDWCAVLGTSYEWELHDEHHDPAGGIVLDYQGGTWCGSRGINRGLRIVLLCPDDAEQFGVPDINEETFVEEDTEAYCEYSIEIETAIACPYQCRTSKIVDGNVEYSVCSGHGICVA